MTDVQANTLASRKKPPAPSRNSKKSVNADTKTPKSAPRNAPKPDRADSAAETARRTKTARLTMLTVRIVIVIGMAITRTTRETGAGERDSNRLNDRPSARGVIDARGAVMGIERGTRRRSWIGRRRVRWI